MTEDTLVYPHNDMLFVSKNDTDKDTTQMNLKAI